MSCKGGTRIFDRDQLYVPVGSGSISSMASIPSSVVATANNRKSTRLSQVMDLFENGPLNGLVDRNGPLGSDAYDFEAEPQIPSGTPESQRTSRAVSPFFTNDEGESFDANGNPLDSYGECAGGFGSHLYDLKLGLPSQGSINSYSDLQGLYQRLGEDFRDGGYEVPVSSASTVRQPGQKPPPPPARNKGKEEPEEPFVYEAPNLEKIGVEETYSLLPSQQSEVVTMRARKPGGAPNLNYRKSFNRLSNLVQYDGKKRFVDHLGVAIVTKESQAELEVVYGFGDDNMYEASGETLCPRLVVGQTIRGSLLSADPQGGPRTKGGTYLHLSVAPEVPGVAKNLTPGEIEIKIADCQKMTTQQDVKMTLKYFNNGDTAKFLDSMRNLQDEGERQSELKLEIGRQISRLPKEDQPVLLKPLSQINVGVFQNLVLALTTQLALESDVFDPQVIREMINNPAFQALLTSSDLRVPFTGIERKYISQIMDRQSDQDKENLKDDLIKGDKLLRDELLHIKKQFSKDVSQRKASLCIAVASKVSGDAGSVDEALRKKLEAMNEMGKKELDTSLSDARQESQKARNKLLLAALKKLESQASAC